MDCIPEFPVFCDNFVGGQCLIPYWIRYNVVERRNAQTFENVSIITNYGNLGGFGAILGKIDCISSPFFPRPDNPLNLLYPNLITPFTFSGLSIVIWARGVFRPILVRIPTVVRQTTMESASLIGVEASTPPFIDDCPSRNWALVNCDAPPDCQPNQTRLDCEKSENGFCCIDNSDIVEWCNRLG